MARDAWLRPDEPWAKYDPNTPTLHKDRYYQSVFQHVLRWARQGSHSGAYFWVYGGLGRSTDRPNEYGMVWLGDPPHEPKGWYAVYNQDTTVKIIQLFASQLFLP
ncbi:hypothetical protein BY458DRAFT_558962 [Sporodiniella umbellata]|nr:hypothetical protein BY458DRAFT_558962 [Sporodiniella umbellata]